MKHLARHQTLEDRSQTSWACLHITRRASASAGGTHVLAPALSKQPFVGASVGIVTWFPFQNASSGNGPSQWPPYQMGSLMDGITFIGTATTIVRLGSFTVLTDPNFLHRGQRAYLGKGLWSRRLTEPAMQPADLPSLDAVVLSHLHGDHFDRIARRQLDHTVPVVTTEHAASRLRGYGFSSHGLQPWSRYELTTGDESLTVESLPAVHAYGALGKLLPPVMGSLLVHRVAGAVRRRVYLSGDTLTGEHLNEIRERHPEIDAAVVHLGGTRLLFWTVTMDADQGVNFLQRIRPRLAVPVHYDDYGIFRSPLSEFLSAMKANLSGQLVEAPARGETVLLGQR